MSLTIALAGNPNCGKTTLFNKLTGANQRVGNWPGVTIDRKTGKVRGHDIDVVDLPGIYSLSPYSPEEIVSRDYLIKDTPDAIVNIVDATNLERNLFLTVQVLDIGIPTVIALNMMDEIEKAGDEINIEKLSKDLGCPVVPISAVRNQGVDELINEVEKIGAQKVAPQPVHLSGDLEGLISKGVKALEGKADESRARFYAVKLLEKDSKVVEEFPEANEALADDIAALEAKLDDDIDSIVADDRYNRISEITEHDVKRAPRNPEGTLSDRIDRIVTHRIWGLPIFIVVLAIVFFGIIGFSYGDFEIIGIGTWCTDWLNGFIEDPIQTGLASWCEENGVGEALSSLLVDGIVGGVGAVIGFLPQMILLFLALVILEDVGYMTRIAFVMDRIFRHFGLSGKSLIPILVGTGCGVPGIMASRTIENEKDRRITAMTVTFIPCGAKLPVIAMLTSAIFPGNGLIAVACYVLGICAVLISGIILKKTKWLAGEATPFIMELPPYHIPSATNIIKSTLDRAWAFVKKAGTIILLACVLIWFLSSYDWGLNYISADEMGTSMLADIGSWLYWIFIPLGWSQTGTNWELTVGAITGLIAKENLVGTFGTLAGVEAGDDGEGLEYFLSAMLTKASGLSVLVFNLICAPCFAAMGAMHRELGTWKATLGAVVYQCVFAYALALIAFGFFGCLDGWNAIYDYDTGALIEDYGIPYASLIAAIVVLAIIIYLLWAKDPFGSLKKLAKKDEETQEASE